MQGHIYVEHVSELESLCALIQEPGGRVPLMLEHSQSKSRDIVVTYCQWARCLDSNIVSYREMEVRKLVLWPHSKYILPEEFKYR